MATTMSPDEAAQKARELLDARVEKVQELASAARDLSAAQEALDASAKTYAQVWAAAERAGWAVSELRQFGLVEPGRRRPGRPRRQSAVADAGSQGTEASSPTE